jgi:hypothetical protein
MCALRGSKQASWDESLLFATYNQDPIRLSSPVREHRRSTIAETGISGTRRRPMTRLRWAQTEIEDAPEGMGDSVGWSLRWDGIRCDVMRDGCNRLVLAAQILAVDQSVV